MDDITVMVLAHPAEPQLAMLEALPADTNVAVGDKLEAFSRAASAADVILNWSAGLELFENVWRMSPRVRWVHARSAGGRGALFPCPIERALAPAKVRLDLS